MTSEQDKIKKDLIASLEGDIPDYSHILELANQIARTDPDHVRFFTDASLIERLGRELVVKQETAVSELVKNSFDADATKVTLTFKDVDRPGGTLIVEDNGHGMGRDQIINGFMRLSTTDKINSPISPQFGRKRAGRKGIGRFAAQRLGKRLRVVSQADQPNYALQVVIDWKMFTGDKDISSVTNQIQQVPSREQTGVMLVIEDLEEAWTVRQIRQVYRYIIDLTQPFPLSKVFKSAPEDPGFEVNIHLVKNGESQQVASVDELVYEHALAQIDGSVDAKGRGSWELKSELLNITEKGFIDKNDDQKKYTALRNIKLRAYYYIFVPEYVPRNVRKSLRDLSLKRGGIRLYRNGFRVLPYGDPGDDWLGLDKQSSKRTFLPPANNTNFLGFVEIWDEHGELFEETSSREGLVENEAVDELKAFAFRTIISGVLRVAEARQRKQRPLQSDVRIVSPEDRIRTAASEVRKAAEAIKADLAKSESDGGDGASTPEILNRIQLDAEQIHQTADILYGLVDEQEQEKAARLEEIEMLRILASMGLTIGEFVHEIKQVMPAIRADINELSDSDDEKSSTTANRVVENLSNLNAYTSLFDRTISDNIRREKEPQELSVVLRRFWKVIKPSCDRYGIEMPEPDIEGYDLFTPPMHPSEWNSILFNLFTNSQKAIKRANSSPGKISISAGREADTKIFVEFSDNGDGIAPEHEERIFDAFFSTTLPKSPFLIDDEEVTGTGLGLKIIKDMITSYQGTIELKRPPKGYQTAFRIELPAFSG